MIKKGETMDPTPEQLDDMYQYERDFLLDNKDRPEFLTDEVKI